jgi:hypothetical protein
MAKQLLAAAHLSVDGVLFLKRLMGIDSLPDVLALFENVYHPHEQAIVDDHTVPILVEHGLIDLNGTVDTTVASWMRTLARPDIEVTLRAMEDSRMRRAVVARSGEQHVMAMRRDEEVVLQALWCATARLEDVVCAPIWAAMRPSPEIPAPQPAHFDPVTMPLERAEQLAASGAPGEMIKVLRTELGLDLAAAKILNEVSAYTGQRCEIAMRESRGVTTVATKAGVLVADTSAGRVVSAVRRNGSSLSVTFGPGTYARFKVAMADLVGLTPSRDWFTAKSGLQ